MRMKLVEVLLGAMLLSGAHAQQTSPRPTVKPDPSPSDGDSLPRAASTGPKTYTIDIGANGYSIEPNRTDAKVGDTIEWSFHSGEHWIIRGTLEHPCIPREYFYEDRERLSTGPMKVDEDSDEKPAYRARLNATDPILFYSGADGDCVDHRMMGVINPRDNINLVNYKARAKDVKFQLRPGDPMPEDEDLPSTTTTSNSPTATDDTPAGTSTSPAEEKDEQTEDGQKDEAGLSNGAIAGMAVGATVALAIFGLSIFYCGRRGGVKIFFTREAPDSPPPSQEVAQGQYPRYATPAATVEPPFRPPRTPGAENWRPSAAVVSRTASPEASMWQQQQQQQSMSAVSPYKNRGSGRGNYSMAGHTPPSTFEERYIPSYYDANVRTPGSGWHDVQYSRVSATPVELPTSSDPGNSPLPQYQPAGGQGRPEARKFSWSGTGEDALFRPLR